MKKIRCLIGIFVICLFVIGCKPMISKAPAGPGGCITQEECRAYCDEHPEECGENVTEEKKEEVPLKIPTSGDLDLPVKKEDVSFKHGGIWPYGVQGGDHPHGHPGIDFEADKGVPIYAVDDGEIKHVGDSGHNVGEKTFTLFPEGIGTGFQIYYTGSFEPKVKSGDKVKRGDIIAYYNLWQFEKGAADVGWLHFALNQHHFEKNGSVCPTNYFNNNAKKDLKELFSKAFYQEQNEFPLLCNKCPEGGCW